VLNFKTHVLGHEPKTILIEGKKKQKKFQIIKMLRSEIEKKIQSKKWSKIKEISIKRMCIKFDIKIF